MRLWPLIALLSLVVFATLVQFAGADAISRLGHMTVYSVGICLSTVLFAFASVASALSLGQAWKREIRGFTRWHSVLVTAGLLIATLYLAYWGVIGIRTWA